MFYHRRQRSFSGFAPGRSLLISLLGFCLGATLVAVSPNLPAIWAPPLLLVLSVFCARKWRGPVVGLLLGIAWATYQGQRLVEQWLPPACERLPVTLRGYVASLPDVSMGPGDRPVQRFLLDVSSLSPGHCAGPARVRLSYYGDRLLAPGEYGEFHARLRVPWALANPGDANREAWYAVNGIHATGSVSRLALDNRPIPWRYRHHSARAALQHAIDQVPGDPRSRGLLAALTVGARQRLAPDDWRLLKELGVVHLAVISGLHVALASAAGAALGRLLARAAILVRGGAALRQLPALLALLAATIYAALAGFSLPTVRALVMLGGALGALALRRNPVSPATLLLAVFVLVLLQPLATVSSGFWLSIGAVSALLWFTAWQPRRRPLATSLRVHLYLCVAMLPLTAWWFGGGSMIAPLANAIAVPVVGLLVVPMTLAASLLEILSPEIARWLWQWPLLLLHALLGLADALAAHTADMRYRPLTGAAYATGNAMLAVAMLGMRVPLMLKVSAGCLLFPLLLRESVDSSHARPQLAVMDVGQGTSVVVTEGRHALVYDTGGGDPASYTVAASAVIPFLRRRGIETIDTLVVSHADRDHSAGVQALLEAFPVARVLLGEPLPGVSRGAACRAGAAWKWPGEVSFQVLTGPTKAGLNANDASCVLMVDLGGYRFLLPGDISVTRERELVQYWREALASDWLLAAHHGSGTSTASAWLRAVDPSGVILNHGRANPFGHPHSDVTRRLDRRGIETRATAKEGAIVFRVNAEGELGVTAARDGYAPFWRPPG